MEELFWLKAKGEDCGLEYTLDEAIDTLLDFWNLDIAQGKSDVDDVFDYDILHEIDGVEYASYSIDNDGKIIYYYFFEDFDDCFEDENE